MTAAHRDLRLARALDDPLFEQLRRALAGGAVGTDQARAVARAGEGLPAGQGTDGDRREGEALAAEEERAREASSFSMRTNGDGTCSGWFRIPDAQADMLGTAVQAFVAPRRLNLKDPK